MKSLIIPGRQRFSPVMPPAKPCAATVAETSATVAIAPATPPPPPPPTPPPAPPAPKSGGLKKISFAKPAKKEETKTNYPVFDGDEATKKQVFEIAGRIKTRDDEIKALAGAQETDKAELKMFVLPFYFQNGHGKSEVPSSVSIPSQVGEVLVTFQNRYKKLPDETSLIPLLGDDLPKYFKQAFSLSIDGSKLPEDAAQQVVNEIQEVLARHHALDALDISEEIKPVATFHEQRHHLFTPEQNLALDAAAPIVAMVKTKGRG